MIIYLIKALKNLNNNSVFSVLFHSDRKNIKMYLLKVSGDPFTSTVLLLADSGLNG